MWTRKPYSSILIFFTNLCYALFPFAIFGMGYEHLKTYYVQIHVVVNNLTLRTKR